MKMSVKDSSLQEGSRSPEGTPQESKKYLDYCRTISFTDSNGVVRELVFPKALDLDRPKRARTTFSREQLEKLESEFTANQYLVGKERSQLARDLGLSETQVKVWFQNRRTKHKRDKEKQAEHQEAKRESIATQSLLHIMHPPRDAPSPVSPPPQPQGFISATGATQKFLNAKPAPGDPPSPTASSYDSSGLHQNSDDNGRVISFAPSLALPFQKTSEHRHLVSAAEQSLLNTCRPQLSRGAEFSDAGSTHRYDRSAAMAARSQTFPSRFSPPAAHAALSAHSSPNLPVFSAASPSIHTASMYSSAHLYSSQAAMAPLGVGAVLPADMARSLVPVSYQGGATVNDAWLAQDPYLACHSQLGSALSARFSSAWNLYPHIPQGLH